MDSSAENQRLIVVCSDCDVVRIRIVVCPETDPCIRWLNLGSTVIFVDVVRSVRGSNDTSRSKISITGFVWYIPEVQSGDNCTYSSCISVGCQWAVLKNHVRTPRNVNRE